MEMEKGKKKGEGRFSKSDGTVRGGGVTSQQEEGMRLEQTTLQLEKK